MDETAPIESERALKSNISLKAKELEIFIEIKMLFNCPLEKIS